MDTEASPLIRIANFPERKPFCKRIPKEIIVTATVLGLFLVGITLLIVIENGKTPPEEEIILEDNLLGFPGFPKDFKKILPGNAWKDDNADSKEKKYVIKHLEKVQDYLQEWNETSSNATKEKDERLIIKELDKVKKWFEEWKKGHSVDNSQDVLGNLMDAELDLLILEILKEAYMSSTPEEINLLEKFLKSLYTPEDVSIPLLESPMKYNKKATDKEWQDKKDFYKKDSLLKGFKKTLSLGSSASNVNALKADAADMQYGSMKFDNVDKGFKKVSKSGIEKLKEMKDFLEAWKNGEIKLKPEMIRDSELQKEIVRNCTLSAKGNGAALSGCPITNLLQQQQSAPELLVYCGVIIEQVQKDLGKCIDLSFLPKECKPTWRTKCFPSYRYRKADGTCNNKLHPTWGKSGTPFVRMVAPDYTDGVSSIRTSKDGLPLPNPRFLSQSLYSKKMRPDSDVTLLFTTFGLIVDHDMVETAANTDRIPCCNGKFDMNPESRPRECLQIDVPAEDPFYGPRKVQCLNFVRSIPIRGECGDRREQLNKATSFLDASAVYGSTIEKTKTLRSFNKGQLRTQLIKNTPFMPSSSTSGYSCGTPSEPLKCFEAGDSRVNMLVGLTAMHTLWYREHNRIAEKLHKMNPQWTDETLFQEARKILIGEMQHITYNEFLPLLLGKEAMDYFQLSIKKDGAYDKYDETIDPSVYNVIGAAAFRFGHSLIKDMIELVGPNNKSEGSVALHQTYFNPQILYDKGLDSLLRGATKQKLNSVDSFISPEVREHLFQPAGKDYGHDLAAVGIQRGRDHGLPSYNKWRSACGLSPIESWDSLKRIMNAERAEKLKEVYKFVDDIDLIPGALAEDHVEGSLLGPTYICIIGRQFQKTRQGDRYWFEMLNSVGSFTKDQLNELYNSNMARIICDNSDEITKIQKSVFIPSSGTNPIVNCEDIPKVDLSKWKPSY